MLTSALWVIEAPERQMVLFGDGNPSGTFGPKKGGGVLGSTPGGGTKILG